MLTPELGGVKLAISDACGGLKKATCSVFRGAGWQRWRVRLKRNVLPSMPKRSQDMIGLSIRTAFAQPNAEHVNTHFDEVTKMLQKSHPKAAEMLEAARMT